MLANKLLPALCAVVLTLAAACDEEDKKAPVDAGQDVPVTDPGGGGDDPGTPDTPQPDPGGEDPGTPDPGPQDAVQPDPGGQDAGQPDTGPAGPFGFTIRLPQMHHIECSEAIPGFEDSMDRLDSDWVCTFDQGGTTGHIYVQATPTDCKVIMSATPIYGDCQGWISIDGVVQELQDVVYDYGGNHNNDWVDFSYAGTPYKYYHSSFGFGWRKCQEMDCAQVLSPADGSVVEDGCTMDRTLPVICREVQEDGTFGELVDEFEPCLGDPNYP